MSLVRFSGYTRTVLCALTAAAAILAAPVSVIAEKLPVRAVVEPVRQAVIATDIAAPVRSIIGREGDRFQAGDLLVALDCQRYEIELKSARAERDARQITQSSNEALLARSAIAKHDVLLSAAEVTKAEAAVEQLRTRIDQCEIRSRFAGTISEVLVHEFEFPKPGEPLMRIISTDELEIRVIIPSDWLSWLAVGTRFRFVVDETGTAHTGRIVRRGAAVDPVSQTITLFGTLDEASPNVIPGMSGSVAFDRKEAAASGGK